MTHVMPDCRFEAYVPDIAMLQDEKGLLDPQFLTKLLIEQEGDIAIYYIPFEIVNPDATIMIVGLTPGQKQMEDAYRCVKDGLSKGLSTVEILELVESKASFSGAMRTNLVRMLDGIGLPKALGIDKSDLLFNECSSLLHTTSVIRFPVFKNGNNYTNIAVSKISKSAMLKRYVFDHFLKEVQSVSRALIIPLGDGVTKRAKRCEKCRKKSLAK